MEKIQHEIRAAFGVPKEMLGNDKPMTATEIRMRINQANLHLRVLEASINKVMSKLMLRLYNTIWMQRVRLWELKLIKTM